MEEKNNSCCSMGLCQSVTQRGCVRVTIVLVGVLLALYLGAEALKTFREYRFVGSGVSATNIITVEGEGKVSAVPDIAEFSFSVTEEAKTPAEAQTKAAEKSNAAITYLKEQGIEEKDLKTLGFTVSPKYRYEQALCTRTYCPPQKQVLDGFTVTQTVEVKVRDIAKAGELLAGIAAKNVQVVSDLRFTLDNEKALQDEARGKAIAEAKEKANTLASQLGVTLVRIVNFNEGGVAMPLMMKRSVAGFDAAMEAGSAAPEIPVGENEFRSNVSISYEVR